MAHRDKTQGFGFVYLNVASLASQGVSGLTAKTHNFNKDPLPHDAPQHNSSRNSPHNSSEHSQSTMPQVKSPDLGIQKIQANLDRLQQLHHKLHVMLEEIETRTKNKKKG